MKSKQHLAGRFVPSQCPQVHGYFAWYSACTLTVTGRLTAIQNSKRRRKKNQQKNGAELSKQGKETRLKKQCWFWGLWPRKSAWKIRPVLDVWLTGTETLLTSLLVVADDENMDGQCLCSKVPQDQTKKSTVTRKNRNGTKISSCSYIYEMPLLMA